MDYNCINKDLLRGKTIAAGYTLSKLARDIGISEVTMYRKINGGSDFTRSEIGHIRMILGLSVDDADKIFFTRQLA